MVFKEWSGALNIKLSRKFTERLFEVFIILLGVYFADFINNNDHVIPSYEITDHSISMHGLNS